MPIIYGPRIIREMNLRRMTFGILIDVVRYDLCAFYCVLRWFTHWICMWKSSLRVVLLLMVSGCVLCWGVACPCWSVWDFGLALTFYRIGALVGLSLLCHHINSLLFIFFITLKKMNKSEFIQIFFNYA